VKLYLHALAKVVGYFQKGAALLLVFILFASNKFRQTVGIVFVVRLLLDVELASTKRIPSPLTIEVQRKA
jgi:hypothetical protein